MTFGLSFFDDRIAENVRTQMVANLQIPTRDESVKRLDRPPCHARWSLSPMQSLSPMSLSSCVTQRTAVILNVLCTNGKTKADNFMAKDPTEWYDELMILATGNFTEQHQH